MDFKIIFLLGQSNMSGEAPITSYSATQLSEKTKVFVWNKGALSYFKAGENNRRRSLFEQKGGMEIELASQIEDNYNGSVMFLKFDEGGTGIASGTGISSAWNSRSSAHQWDDSQFLQAIIQIDAFEKFFAKNFPDDTFTYSAMVWNQGEQDSGVLANANAYEVNCGNMFTDFKTHINVPNLPIYDFLISDIVVGTLSNKAIVNQAKQNLRAVHANGGVLYSTNASNGYALQDTVHYDFASYTLAGQRLYNDLITNGHL